MSGDSVKPSLAPPLFVWSTGRMIERLSTDVAACSWGWMWLSSVFRVMVQMIGDDVSRLAREAASAAVVRWRSPAASQFRAALEEEVRALQALAALLRAC
jgi:hypothetical protein